ncbi:MAG: Eco57I restriction-modification methylase domain-containing protein, partial [Firmicutes bacterium]|nr:Eco57I restriction-modification methylase domain-containing protein [Bacillota bacterium]
GGGASAVPLYNKFVEQAIGLSPRYLSMIIPARWTSGAGKGLDNFTKSMLSCRQIKYFNLYLNSKQCFPDVDIKGGVCYFLFDSNHNDKANVVVNHIGSNKPIQYTDYLDRYGIGAIIVFEELKSIFEKVRDDLSKNGAVSNIVYSRRPFGISSNVIKKSTKDSVNSIYDEKSNDDDIQLIGLQNNKRCTKWIAKDFPYTDENNILTKYKVLIAKAYGCGAFGETTSTPILSTPILSTPNQVCTETFLAIGSFEQKILAQNLIKYIYTKFFRALVGILKTTQNTTARCYELVPLQDFGQSSDIDWDKSIDDIDNQLFEKYKLTQEEIDFIQINVAPMKGNADDFDIAKESDNE